MLLSVTSPSRLYASAPGRAISPWTTPTRSIPFSAWLGKEMARGATYAAATMSAIAGRENQCSATPAASRAAKARRTRTARNTTTAVMSVVPP